MSRNVLITGCGFKRGGSGGTPGVGLDTGGVGLDTKGQC